MDSFIISGSTGAAKYSGQIKPQVFEKKQVDAPIQDSVIINDNTGLNINKTIQPPSKLIPLTILHTNDLHGHVESEDRNAGPTGGMAQLASKIEEERRKDPVHTFLFDAGDTIQGSPISDFFDGKPVTESMNKIGYDAMALGNHDFDNGLSSLAKKIEDTDSPIIAANLNVNSSDHRLSDKARPYVINEVDGVKIGIIGLVTPDSIQMLRDQSEAKDIRIDPPEKSLSEYIPKIKQDGADIIVLLSHLGVDVDMKIAEKFPDISVIIGGHTHTEIQKPLKCGNTLIMQAGCNGKFLGKAELQIDRESKSVKLKDYSLIPIDSDIIEPDREVLSIIRKYEQLVGPKMREKIGSIKRNLTQRDFHQFREESNLGNAVTDVMKTITGADIGFITNGSLRCNLYKGDITAGDIYSLFPWSDNLAVVKLKGKYIKAMIEQGLGTISNGVSFSGMKAIIKTSNPSGQQVMSVKGDNGEPIDNEKVYTIATREYIAKKLTGIDILDKAKEIKIYGELRESVIEGIKRTETIDTKKDGRLINVERSHLIKSYKEAVQRSKSMIKGDKQSYKEVNRKNLAFVADNNQSH